MDTAEPPTEYDAVNPSSSTLLSDVNTTRMLPVRAVNEAGRLLPPPVRANAPAPPLKLPIRLVPSYTSTKSYPASVANELKVSVMAAPVEIVHEHAWLAE